MYYAGFEPIEMFLKNDLFLADFKARIENGVNVSSDVPNRFVRVLVSCQWLREPNSFLI